MLKIDTISSQRLAALRFPLIVGVVFIHAYTADMSFAGETLGLGSTGAFATFIRDIISQGVARIAVPLFFLMSGYLFFADFDGTTASYRAKLRSRARTLLIPLIAWNGLNLLFQAGAQNTPGLQTYFSGKNGLISGFSLFDIVNAIFGLTRLPISHQFWFIRDLILLVLLTPVLYKALRHAPLATVGVLGALWLFNLWPMPLPSPVAAFFFTVGCALAMKGLGLFDAIDRYPVALPLAYLPVLLADTLSKGQDVNPVLHNLNAMVGVAAALSLSRALLWQPRVKQWLLAASQFSFFVFAIHEPMLTVVRKLLYKVAHPERDASVLLIYFTAPLLTIALAMLIHHGLSRVAPRLTGLLSGGR